jgi:hypothetical protein
MISLDINNPKASGDYYLGKLRGADKHRNEYYLFDDGKNPDESLKRNWRKTL